MGVILQVRLGEAFSVALRPLPGDHQMITSVHPILCLNRQPFAGSPTGLFYFLAWKTNEKPAGPDLPPPPAFS